MCFVSFVVHEHPIPSVMIRVHLWLKKTSIANQVCGSGGTSPSPRENTRLRFACFVTLVVHEHPIPSVVIRVHPWLKKTSIAIQVCGSGGTSPSPRKQNIIRLPCVPCLSVVSPENKSHQPRSGFAAQVELRPPQRIRRPENSASGGALVSR